MKRYIDLFGMKTDRRHALKTNEGYPITILEFAPLGSHFKPICFHFITKGTNEFIRGSWDKVTQKYVCLNITGEYGTYSGFDRNQKVILMEDIDND